MLMPYIVEQSCMGASRSFVCVKRQQTPMSTNVHFEVQAIALTLCKNSLTSMSILCASRHNSYILFMNFLFGTQQYGACIA